MKNETDEVEIEGGYVTIRGEKRFIPLRTKAIAHCKSCLFFNTRYESCSRGYATTSMGDASACPEYTNRTHKR